MEVVMFIQPTIAAYMIYYQRLDLEKEAYNAVARRQFRPAARPVKLKIPTRVPRTWRWRYLWAK
jgi:hypothetical protein